MKRILALFCMLTLLLPLFAFTASAASEDGCERINDIIRY